MLSLRIRAAFIELPWPKVLLELIDISLTTVCMAGVEVYTCNGGWFYVLDP